MSEFTPEIIPTNSLLPQMKTALAINQRKIFLYDEVNENSVFECIYYLNKLTDMDNRIGVKLPIDIMINTNGGYVYDGLTLISLIEQLIEDGYNIKTTNIGRAFSMGSIIAICGSERNAYRYSRYMIHDISSGTMGTLTQIHETVEELEHLRTTINDIILRKTKITSNMLEDWQNRKFDKFFNAQEALKYGLTDKII